MRTVAWEPDPPADAHSAHRELNLQQRIDAAMVAAAYLRGIGYDDPEFRAGLYDLVLDGLAAMKERLTRRAKVKKELDALEIAEHTEV